MLVSQFSAVDRPLALAPKTALTPTRSAIGFVLCNGSPVDHVKAGLLQQSQHDVLEHCHSGNEGEVLMNEAHAQFVSGVRVSITTGLPSTGASPASGRDQACKNADQGRLAGNLRHEAMESRRAGMVRVAPRNSTEPPIGFAVPIADTSVGAEASPPWIFHRNFGSHCSAAGCSARNFSILSEVTRTAGTSTAFGSVRPGLHDIRQGITMLWPSV